MIRIYGRELKVGDMIETWMPDKTVMVKELGDYRVQTLNGREHSLCSAYCTDGYNITVFLDERDIRLVRAA